MLNDNPASSEALGKSDLTFDGHGGLSVKIESMFILSKIDKERKSNHVLFS